MVVDNAVQSASNKSIHIYPFKYRYPEEGYKQPPAS